MPTTAQYTCANPACKKLFTARVADRARGWARFCSKSCKAFAQASRGRIKAVGHKVRESIPQIVPEKKIEHTPKFYRMWNAPLEVAHPPFERIP
jgi:hypothetical protein